MPDTLKNVNCDLSSHRLIIVTGGRNSGKTTWCMKNLPEADGVISLKAFCAGVHVGYDAFRPRSCEKTPLLRIASHQSAGTIGETRAGKYEIMVDGLRIAVDWIREATKARPKALIIDEIGRLELAGGGFDAALRELIVGNFNGTIVLTVRRDFVEPVKHRYDIVSSLLVDVE